MSTVVAAFLLGFPALFSIVNPVSGAFIFRTRTVDRSHADRVRLARRVGVYAALVMLVALWAGSYVLAFFGITLPALRCAGGVVLALYAWSSLNAPERREARKTEQLDAASGQDDPAFYPLTLPFTTGPARSPSPSPSAPPIRRAGWHLCPSSRACRLLRWRSRPWSGCFTA